MFCEHQGCWQRVVWVVSFPISVFKAELSCLEQRGGVYL